MAGYLNRLYLYDRMNANAAPAIQGRLAAPANPFNASAPSGNEYYREVSHLSSRINVTRTKANLMNTNRMKSRRSSHVSGRLTQPSCNATLRRNGPRLKRTRPRRTG